MDMELKIGDKVRYLDAVGGGTVVAFKGKDMVMVLEPDGFETPALKRQCVVVESAPDPGTAPSTNRKPEGNAPQKVTPIPTPIPVLQKKEFVETRAGERLNVSLAFLPAEGHAFQEALFEAYLINESNYALLYNYASCSGKTWVSRSSGTIAPNSKLFLEEFDREAINDLEKVSFQLLAFKDGAPYAFKNPLSVEMRLDTVKFFKRHCFQENDFFDEEALVVAVVKNDVPEKTLLIDPEEIRKAMLDTRAEKPKGSQPLPASRGPLEVDLHIDQLLDSTAGMDAAAILQYQLDVFRRTMEENKHRKGAKIVFIHGKGDGVLRAAILNELKSAYKTCRSQDASFREYGFGATLVLVG